MARGPPSCWPCKAERTLSPVSVLQPEQQCPARCYGLDEGIVAALICFQIPSPTSGLTPLTKQNKRVVATLALSLTLIVVRSYFLISPEKSIVSSYLLACFN